LIILATNVTVENTDKHALIVPGPGVYIPDIELGHLDVVRTLEPNAINCVEVQRIIGLSWDG